MIEFLAGAVTISYLIAGVYFLRFWKKTGDRLFLHFACAFWLFMLNQIAVSALDISIEQTSYAYILRVFGFIVILLAIINKNTSASNKRVDAKKPPRPQAH